MPDDAVSVLFWVYSQFQKAVKQEGVKEVLDDLSHFYPDLYSLLDEEFERRQRVRKLGVLLAGPM